ncbi:unnamed protein product [Rhodiola kirilowii]
MSKLALSKGRSIHEIIALAHDLLFDFNREGHGGNLMIKMDMSKAYDRISWSFIMAALCGCGFSESYGLRQGDPLSPTLFVIGMEWMSKAIDKMVHDGLISAYETGCNFPRINHLLFTDDIVFFTNGSGNSMTNLLHLVKEFCSPVRATT